MKTPKLLPWYARKAGVSTERANVLWRRAVREATAETGWVGNAEYWRESMSIFLRLLDEERGSFCLPRMTLLVRSQNRLWRLPLTAMEDVIAAIRTTWQRNRSTFQRRIA